MTERRTLPARLDAERTVIGGILLYAAAFHQVTGLLTAEDFYHPAHREIFKACTELDASSKPIDQLTIAEQMTTNGSIATLRAFNGIGYFGELMSAAVTVENIAFHARAIESASHRRKIIETAQSIAAAGYGARDDADFFGESEAAWFALSARQASRSYVHVRTGLRGLADALEGRRGSPGGVVGIASGWPDLDRIHHGWQAGKLYVVAARPAMGKSAAAVNIAVHSSVVQRCPVLFFSLEMPGCNPEGDGGELVERCIQSHGGIDGDRMQVGILSNAEWARFPSVAGELATSPLWVDDRPGQTLVELRSKARQWRAKDAPMPGKAMIVVDYLQLVRSPQKGRDSNREREIAEVSGGLKNLAKELRVPVLALAQLNRGVEDRADKRPMLSDLRESGAIEQDADVVAFLYREFVYNQKADPKAAELIIGKHRGGATGTVHLEWLANFTRFDSTNQRNDP